MKVPARRRGNPNRQRQVTPPIARLNESPRPKAGKCSFARSGLPLLRASMKVPARRRGNVGDIITLDVAQNASMKVPARRRGNHSLQKPSQSSPPLASMKVPARRRGNADTGAGAEQKTAGLNESPRPKAGKSCQLQGCCRVMFGPQ